MVNNLDPALWKAVEKLLRHGGDSAACTSITIRESPVGRLKKAVQQGCRERGGEAYASVRWASGGCENAVWEKARLGTLALGG